MPIQYSSGPQCYAASNVHAVLASVREDKVLYGLVRHGVDGGRYVARVIRTRIDVAVIFRQQVDVVKEIAFVISPLACLHEADVEQHAAVKPADVCLSSPTVQKNLTLITMRP